VHMLNPSAALNVLEKTLQEGYGGTVVVIVVDEDIAVNSCPKWLQQTLPASWYLQLQNTSKTDIATMSFDTAESAIAILVRLSKEILKLGQDDKLSEQRPYFEIGFDSLMLNTLKSRLHNETGVNVPIAQFFKYSTLALL